MTQPHRIGLNHVLLGDELGQIKLVQLDPNHNYDQKLQNEYSALTEKDIHDDVDQDKSALDSTKLPCCNYPAATLKDQRHLSHRHRIVRIIDDCIREEPAASRAIATIRPIHNIHESNLDTTDRPNHLFLISNKVGQLFICNTDAIRSRLRLCTEYEVRLVTHSDFEEEDGDGSLAPVLSPIYYNMNGKVPISGGQPINRTNILVVYQNGDIQHVNIGQNVLQSSLKIKRKAIRMLGLAYNSDAKAIHWRIDGSSGICYFDSNASTAHMDESDPMTEIVLRSPTHKLTKKRTDKLQHNQYDKSPCIKSRKYNEQDRLVPIQVINMITTRAERDSSGPIRCKWNSITSLNLIYRKLALYDLVGSENFEQPRETPKFGVNCFKLNDNRLAVGGCRYTVRIYDVQTQKAIFNCKTGSSGNPLACPSKGEHMMVGDIDWLGGNKTTKKSPHLLATCSGVDSIVKVYDLRSPSPVFYIDLTHQTENKWQPYDNQPRGCMFTKICASAAPYSTAVPSQQLALGSTNGQLHLVDLRFGAKSHRTLGKLSGFCGGSLREVRFVAESFEASKVISCATDRFVRIHKIQTSFTSVISQKLATRVFMGTKPTCIQPVCDEIAQNYLASLGSRCGSESQISTVDSSGWSLL